MEGGGAVHPSARVLGGMGKRKVNLNRKTTWPDSGAPPSAAVWELGFPVRGPYDLNLTNLKYTSTHFCVTVSRFKLYVYIDHKWRFIVKVSPFVFM